MSTAETKEKEAPKQEDEEEEECGFCIFMKGGGCKESFTNWSKCVDEHREGSKDFTEECKDTTLALQDCMMEHKDYYKDFLGLAEGEEKQSSGDKASRSAVVPGVAKQAGESIEKGKESKQQSETLQAEMDGASDTSCNKKENNEAGSEDNSKTEKRQAGTDEKTSQKGNDPNTSERLEGTPAEKHNRASADSESKQARTHEQETNPVKAKPDESKKQEAASQPPRPDREENKQDTKEEEEPDSDTTENGGEEDNEGEEEDDKLDIQVGTAPYDRRFVTTNQARHCYTRYQEYHRCAAEKGDGSKDCSFFQKAYRAICPGDWVDNWNEQREAGTFAGRY